MADVRGASGAPGLGAFGGVASPTPSSPLYIDLATGDLYAVLTGDIVTKVGSISADANLVITQQVFGHHVEKPNDPVSAETHIANRIFDKSVINGLYNAQEANDVIRTQVFRTGARPSTWG